MKKDNFINWLNRVKGFLPKKMTLREAKEIYERKIKENDRMEFNSR